jgi:mono/diheme cytochrome c family protein
MTRWLPIAVGAITAMLAFGIVVLASDDSAEDDDPVATVAALPTTGGHGGMAIYARMGCGGCHRLAAAASTGEIGPSLDRLLPSHTPTSLRAKIVSPTPGTAMPSDFGKRLSGAELDALVSFLMAARSAR